MLQSKHFFHQFILYSTTTIFKKTESDSIFFLSPQKQIAIQEAVSRGPCSLQSGRASSEASSLQSEVSQQGRRKL